MQISLQFTLNGTPVTMAAESSRRLVDLLREDLGLTGTKEGCGVGECGACTVILNGRPVNSCLVLAGQIEGADILTVEGLAEEDGLHPLQQAFLEAGAIQCGFCTPGMLMSAYGLLSVNPSPSEDEIRLWIAGNLCRCTGYKQIVQAIKAAARAVQKPAKRGHRRGDPEAR